MCRRRKGRDSFLKEKNKKPHKKSIKDKKTAMNHDGHVTETKNSSESSLSRDLKKQGKKETENLNYF